MNKQITFSQYRLIDLGMMAGLLVLSQAVIYLASSRLFPDQLYVVSPVAAIVAIVMMRWDWRAVLHALLGGAVFCWLSGGRWEHYLIYCVGNAASLAALLLFRLLGKKRIRSDTFLSLTFALCVQLAMQLGRAALAAALGFGGPACLRFITTDLLSELFTLFIVWIVRRQDGLFEDQKQYLLRVQSERQIEGRE